jgi:hypothetical protein
MAPNRQFNQHCFMALFLFVLALITGVLGDENGNTELGLRSKEDPPRSVDICPTTELIVLPNIEQCGAPAWYPLQGDYAPWTQRPMCVRATGQLLGGKSDGDTYCIFSKKDFAEGRGVSMVTTTSMAKLIAQLPAFTKPETIKSMNDLIDGPFGPPPYEARRFPVKGIGMVANRTIVRGDRILQETVTWLYHRSTFMAISEKDRIPLSWHGIYALPEEARDELLALHAHHGGDQIDDIMRTNAFGAYYTNDELHNNVLPRISRFNHDCRPKLVIEPLFFRE